MSKQVKYFILIPLIVMSINVVLTKLFDRMYEINVYGQTGGNLNYYLNMKRPDILIMGASTVRHNIDPDSISNSCFNLSHNGMRDGFNASVVEMLEDQNHLPNEMLFYSVEIDNYVPGVNVKRDIETLKFYYYENKNIRKNINENSTYDFLKYIFSLYKYNSHCSSLFLNTFKTLMDKRTDKGFYYLPKSSTDSMNAVIQGNLFEKMVKNSPDFDVKIFKQSMANEYLDMIISICKRNDIKLVLFTTPTYKKNYTDKTLEQFAQYINSKNVTFIDMHSREEPLLADPKLWKDGFHLNEDGSRIFTSLFKKELVKQNIIPN